MKFTITVNQKKAGTVDLRPDGFDVDSSHPRAQELKELLESYYRDGLPLSVAADKPTLVKGDDRRFFIEIGIALRLHGFLLGA